MDQPDSALSWVEDSARLIAIHYQPAYVDRVGLHTCSVFYTLQEKLDRSYFFSKAIIFF